MSPWAWARAVLDHPLLQTSPTSFPDNHWDGDRVSGWVSIQGSCCDSGSTSIISNLGPRTAPQNTCPEEDPLEQQGPMAQE